MSQNTPTKWLLFSDESGTTPEFKCYGIGILTIQETQLEDLNNWFGAQRDKHGVHTEVKWKGIDNKSHGRMNFALDLFHTVIKSSARLTIMVVHKEYYEQWRTGSKEMAFYKTFTQLLNHALKGAQGDYSVLMDERSDSYTKHEEVITLITNRMASKHSQSGRLIEVSKEDSKLTPGIQIADILCGAITAASNLHLDPGMQIKAGKKFLIRRLADIIGWDSLWYDTYPNDQLNIWHFPSEWRGIPGTRKINLKPTPPNYATEDQLLALRKNL